MKSSGKLKAIHIIEIPECFYFKVGAAGRYLGISPNALRKYTDLGLIRARRLPCGDRLYCKDDLDEFVDSLDDAIEQKAPVGRHAIDLELVQSDLSATPRKEDRRNGN